MAVTNLPKSEGSAEEIPQKPPTFLNTVKAVVFKNLFPISLVFFVALGILAPEPGVFFSKLPTHYVCVIGVFLHSGLKLKTGEVTDAFKAFKALIWDLGCYLYFVDYADCWWAFNWIVAIHCHKESCYDRSL